MLTLTNPWRSTRWGRDLRVFPCFDHRALRPIGRARLGLKNTVACLHIHAVLSVLFLDTDVPHNWDDNLGRVFRSGGGHDYQSDEQNLLKWWIRAREDKFYISSSISTNKKQTNFLFIICGGLIWRTNKGLIETSLHRLVHQYCTNKYFQSSMNYELSWA